MTTALTNTDHTSAQSQVQEDRRMNSSVEQLDWPAQWRLRAGPSRPTSLSAESPHRYASGSVFKNSHEHNLPCSGQI